MRTLTLATLLLAVPLAAHAAEPATQPSAGIAIDCAAIALPSQRTVGTLLGLDNLGQVYAARTRLMGEAQRACHRQSGTGRIVLVPERAALPAQTALVRR